LNALLAIYFYNYISSGVGQLIKEELTFKQILFASILTLFISYLFSSTALFIVALLALVIMAKFFTTRLGGLNGDIYGFIIEVTELLLLNYIIVTHTV